MVSPFFEFLTTLSYLPSSLLLVPGVWVVAILAEQTSDQKERETDAGAVLRFEWPAGESLLRATSWVPFKPSQHYCSGLLSQCRTIR